MKRRRTARSAATPYLRVLLLLLTAQATRVSALSAQTIGGLLLEKGTRRPIELVTVAMLGQRGDTLASTLSDKNGFFLLAAPKAGTFRLIASALGYRAERAGPFELEDDGLRIVDLTLEPEPVEIEGINVETTPLTMGDDALIANGFLERMQAGRGEFLTPADIESSDAWYTPELFRGLGRTVVRPGIRAGPWNDRVRMRRVTAGGFCTPRIFVDGVWVKWRVGSLEDLVPKDELQAVEIFDRLQAPLRYVGTSGCGAILLWTRNR